MPRLHEFKHTSRLAIHSFPFKLARNVSSSLIVSSFALSHVELYSGFLFPCYLQSSRILTPIASFCLPRNFLPLFFFLFFYLSSRFSFFYFFFFLLNRVFSLKKLETTEMWIYRRILRIRDQLFLEF